MSTTTDTLDLATEAISDDTPIQRPVTDIDLSHYHRSFLPSPVNRIKPVTCKHWIDTCKREGYVDKLAMIAELTSSGERLEEYRERTYYQGSFNPEAVQREEENMMIFPSARHDYDFDDFYQDTQFLHDYFVKAQARSNAIRAREQRAREEAVRAQTEPPKQVDE